MSKIVYYTNRPLNIETIFYVCNTRQKLFYHRFLNEYPQPGADILVPGFIAVFINRCSLP